MICFLSNREEVLRLYFTISNIPRPFVALTLIQFGFMLRAKGCDFKKKAKSVPYCSEIRMFRPYSTRD